MAVNKKKAVCCEEHHHHVLWGSVLIILGFALKLGMSFSEIFMVAGIVFVLKGLIWSKCK